jgi:hypothetical protein
VYEVSSGVGAQSLPSAHGREGAVDLVVETLQVHPFPQSWSVVQTCAFATTGNDSVTAANPVTKNVFDIRLFLSEFGLLTPKKACFVPMV